MDAGESLAPVVGSLTDLLEWKREPRPVALSALSWIHFASGLVYLR